jgi:hypothetical protein
MARVCVRSAGDTPRHVFRTSMIYRIIAETASWAHVRVMKDNRISFPHLVNPKAELSKQFDDKKAVVRKRRLSEHPLRSPVNGCCLAHASPRV